ncbi:MAG TPA: hypothetical protein VG796_15660 [Verrucomicrobiales bacterium]|jgi:hypothetical protein|nr:hypothetical protein [Verrucomicrobiales bacterium]
MPETTTTQAPPPRAGSDESVPWQYTIGGFLLFLTLVVTIVAALQARKKVSQRRTVTLEAGHFRSRDRRHAVR